MAGPGTPRERTGRLERHPVLAVGESEPIAITWEGRPVEARLGEVISSALIASGIDVFAHHTKDGTPLGLFCANGQCGQCTVVADGVPVKACMTPVRPGMTVHSVDRSAETPLRAAVEIGETKVRRCEVLVVGAGPAGLAAARELGSLGIDTVIVDDKPVPGGKLVLQTHKFFGSVDETHAGERGVDIAAELADGLDEMPFVELWLEATAVAAFSDHRVGVVRNGGYVLVRPDVVLVATGARERQLPFPGHTLPGVYGAGAFQTLLNRDRVIPGRRLLVVGGGNVGLIAAYHAVQAGIEVVAVVEFLPEAGGYDVHADKLRRLGVPVRTSHTVLAAHGHEHVEAVTIAPVDRYGRPQRELAETHAVDLVLVAVGLAPLDELAGLAEQSGIPVFRAGDASAIAEASAATFSGRIAARDIAATLRADAPPVPDEWRERLVALAAGPGPRSEEPVPAPDGDLYPVVRCCQEIPCNPCSTVCSKHAIELLGDPLRGRPVYVGDCTGCAKCIAICPGLAITLVDARHDPAHPVVTVPFELDTSGLEPGTLVLATDPGGVPIGRFPVVDVKVRRWQDRTSLVRITTTADTADRVAGIRVQDPADLQPIEPLPVGETPDDLIVCRCEHVTAGEIREAIRSGIHDINEMKAALRVCMGACCGRNCPDHIAKLYRDEGIDDAEVTAATLRPVFVEVPLGVFAAGTREP